ncbi:MAG TPA: zinc ribbon domain-containing protein [Solirubrobacteraceae bacterium]|jgi:putative FmdB family regulatory protein
MPIYEYRRPDGSTFEIVQSFSDDSLTHDPETGVEVQRVLHAPALHFKGKGFYNTDYGTRKRQRENAAASAEGSSASGSSSSNGDSKASGEKGSKDGGSSKGSAAESSKSAEGSSSSKSEKGASGSKKSEAVGAKS